MQDMVENILNKVIEGSCQRAPKNTFQYINCKKVDTMRHKCFFLKRYCTLIVKIDYKLAITNHAQKSKLLHLLSHVTNNLSDSAVGCQ